MSILDEQLEALVVTVLAVGGYNLEKVYNLLPEFHESGLTIPVLVTGKGVGEVMMALAKAGYDRGLLTEMMAGRLVNLMSAVIEGKLEGLNEFVQKDKRDEAITLLCSVKGIGPKVASDAWILMRTGQ